MRLFYQQQRQSGRDTDTARNDLADGGGDLGARAPA